jgi:hypothetical protein
MFAGLAIGGIVSAIAGFFGGMIGDIATNTFHDLSFFGMLAGYGVAAGCISGAVLGYWREAAWARGFGRLMGGLIAAVVFGFLTGGVVGMILQMMSDSVTSLAPIGYSILAGITFLTPVFGGTALFNKNRYLDRAAGAVFTTVLFSLFFAVVGGFIVGGGVGFLTTLIWPAAPGILIGGSIALAFGAGGIVGALIVNHRDGDGMRDILDAIGAGASKSSGSSFGANFAGGMAMTGAFEMASGHGLNPTSMIEGGLIGGATGSPVLGGAISNSLNN